MGLTPSKPNGVVTKDGLGNELHVRTLEEYETKRDRVHDSAVYEQDLSLAVDTSDLNTRKPAKPRRKSI